MNTNSYDKGIVIVDKLIQLYNLDAINKSELIFLEGYLWDEGEPKKAFDKAINNAKKTSMSLSDRFCVDRHKPHFLNLVKNKLDITFSNEQEIMSLLETKKFDDVIKFGKEIGKIIIITRGEKGSIAINKNEIVECDSKKNLTIIMRGRLKRYFSSLIITFFQVYPHPKYSYLFSKYWLWI